MIQIQTGDFAAVTVKSSPACGCPKDVPLSWVIIRDEQFVTWGQEYPDENEQHECLYRLG